MSTIRPSWEKVSWPRSGNLSEAAHARKPCRVYAERGIENSEPRLSGAIVMIAAVSFSATIVVEIGSANGVEAGTGEVGMFCDELDISRLVGGEFGERFHLGISNA